MNAKIDLGTFREWRAKVNFAEHGDKLERDYCTFVLNEFPNVQEFWRVFVVPLTTRLDDYPKPTRPSIQYRPATDESLQHICGANYSVYVHLAFAKAELSSWEDERSLETVYVRLSSAFDVFEALCFAFAKLIHTCKGSDPVGLEKLDEDAITKKASNFFRTQYSEAFKRFRQKGQAVNVRLHTADKLLADFFSGTNTFGKYKNHSGNVRRMRNALVHDVRLERIQDQDGKIMLPKPAAVNRYRSWSEIQAAALNVETVQKDFNVPRIQAESDTKESMAILNSLYGKLLQDFDGEFFSAERSKLRDLFQVEHGQPAEKKPRARGVILVETAGSNTCPVVATASGVSLTAQLSGLNPESFRLRERYRDEAPSGSDFLYSGTGQISQTPPEDPNELGRKGFED